VLKVVSIGYTTLLCENFVGFRFQKRVSLFPGVRINFSPNGISTTIGVRGASVNLGSKDAYLNLGMPGSGLSYRTRLDQPAEVNRGVEPTPAGWAAEAPSVCVPLPGEVEIRSSAIECLTSPGLEDLKKLINEAANRKALAFQKIAAVEIDVQDAERAYRFALSVMIRLLKWRQLPALRQNVISKRTELVAAQEELAGCHVDLDFAFDAETFAAFSRLQQAYAHLRNCSRIWDITTTAKTDRIAQRTTATEAIDRKAVRLDYAQDGIISTKWEALRFGNANGQDIYLYPGFVMMRDPGRDFALIDVREVNVEFSITQFIEEGALPSDSEVIGHTWKKANKDGSPDRRFANNYEIPIVRYGELRLRSTTGINEAYLFSTAATAETFAATIRAYQAELSALAKRSRAPAAAFPNASDTSKSETNADPLASSDADLKPLPKPRVLVADGGVLVAAALLVAAFLWLGPLGPTFLPRITMNRPVIGSEVAAAPASIKATPVAPKPRVIIKAASVNIRVEPSTNAKVVRSAPNGTRFDVLGHEGNWVKVGNDAAIGWIHGSLIEDTAPE
jgi:hypothetical protein